MKSDTTSINGNTPHLIFRPSHRFTQMQDMKEITPYLENYDNFVFFEPKPFEKPDDNTLEGCLRHAAKLEQMIDKNNLY